MAFIKRYWWVFAVVLAVLYFRVEILGMLPASARKFLKA